MWITLCWCVAPLFLIVGVVVFDIRFRQLESAMLISSRRGILARSALESAAMLALGALSPWGLATALMGAVDLIATLVADVQLGRQQMRDRQQIPAFSSY